MTFFSGCGAVKDEHSNSLPVASLSTRVNLPSEAAVQIPAGGDEIKNASRVLEVW